MIGWHKHQGVSETPKNADVICEQPLKEAAVVAFKCGDEYAGIVGASSNNAYRSDCDQVYNEIQGLGSQLIFLVMKHFTFYFTEHSCIKF